MKKDKVIFKKFPEGDVIALFPEMVENKNSKGVVILINSYQHIGQHGGASPALIEELDNASPVEYASLLQELKNIGYNPKVIK